MFVLFYWMDPIFYQKNLQNNVFFVKKIEILKIKNFNKIPLFSITFLLFSIFGILFSISPIQTCPKIMESFVVFYWKG